MPALLDHRAYSTDNFVPNFHRPSISSGMDVLGNTRRNFNALRLLLTV
jgi:hypothetical protein